MTSTLPGPAEAGRDDGAPRRTRRTDPPVNGANLISGRKSITGSGIGGMAETLEMIDFCAEHGVVSDVEIIPIQAVNEAWERMDRNDVK